MIKVSHRINTIKHLRNIPASYGVEIDLRDDGKNIILNHDPFKPGELFEDYCKEYKHALMLLNVKTEGIEDSVLKIVKKYKIKNYVFLDITFPTILKLAKKREKNIAIRFSEFEPIENALALKGKIKWVWVDTFTCLPLTKNIYQKIKKAGFKLFLVGPDRWGRPKDIKRYADFLRKNNIRIDAVMSELKLLNEWALK